MRKIRNELRKSLLRFLRCNFMNFDEGKREKTVFQTANENKEINENVDAPSYKSISQPTCLYLSRRAIFDELSGSRLW